MLTGHRPGKLGTAIYVSMSTTLSQISCTAANYRRDFANLQTLQITYVLTTIAILSSSWKHETRCLLSTRCFTVVSEDNSIGYQKDPPMGLVSLNSVMLPSQFYRHSVWEHHFKKRRHSLRSWEGNSPSPDKKVTLTLVALTCGSEGVTFSLLVGDRLVICARNTRSVSPHVNQESMAFLCSCARRPPPSREATSAHRHLQHESNESSIASVITYTKIEMTVLKMRWYP